jgi:hypothetical protein
LLQSLFFLCHGRLLRASIGLLDHCTQSTVRGRSNQKSKLSLDKAVKLFFDQLQPVAIRIPR